jgi:hypothetical protein
MFLRLGTSQRLSCRPTPIEHPDSLSGVPRCARPLLDQAADRLSAEAQVAPSGPRPRASLDTRCGHWFAIRSRMSSLRTSVASDFSIFARINSRSGPESLRPRNIGTADTETLLWRTTRLITLAPNQSSPELAFSHPPQACVSSKAKQYRSLPQHDARAFSRRKIGCQVHDDRALEGRATAHRPVGRAA